MSATTHPTTTAPAEQGSTVEWSRDSGKVEAFHYRGTADQVEAKATQIAAQWSVNGKPVSHMRYSTLNGRGELIASYTRGNGITFIVGPNEDGIVEELYGVDVLKDVLTAPAFENVDAYYLNVVVQAWEQALEEDATWTDEQKLLYRMLAHGQDSYIETAFVYRRNYYRATKDELRLSFQDINRVDQQFAGLTQRMKKLIDALPAGEWLKKPPQAEYTGQGVWRLTQEWQWAEKWSNLYGGTLDFGITLP